MTVKIDDLGRIQLPTELMSQLSLKPGDEVSVVSQNGQWFIHSTPRETGLAFRRNVLVHFGTSEEPPEKTLEKIRQERFTSVEHEPLP